MRGLHLVNWCCVCHYSVEMRDYLLIHCEIAYALRLFLSFHTNHITHASTNYTVPIDQLIGLGHGVYQLYFDF